MTTTYRTAWTPRQLRLFAAFGADLQERGIWGYADYAPCHTDAMCSEERALDAAGVQRVPYGEENGRRLVRVDVGGRLWWSVEATQNGGAP